MSETLVPAAEWTPDCQGKQDYDGPLLSISTRYWPGASVPNSGFDIFERKDGKVSHERVPYHIHFEATSSIVLNIGPLESNGCSFDTKTWKTETFTGSTEAEVKFKVETWVQERFDEIRKLLNL